MSRFTSPIDIDDVASQASGALSASSLPSVFGRMMAGQTVPSAALITRDICQRPVPIYNDLYNPNLPEPTLRASNYSPYANGQPLFDDRPVIVANLPQGKVLAPASKRTRTAWVWRIGYALVNNAHHKKPLLWACKHCHHDTRFSKHKEYIFNSNSLKNAERHLLQHHFLDEGGDTWRLTSTDEPTAQASGLIGDSYEKVIPFRQLEFKNAYLEWVIMDDIKHRKAASLRLQRLFKIANSQITNALPSSHTTVGHWIDDMFAYFEPEIIAEIAAAKSKISISFDGWGSKREKISVLGCIVHFVNNRNQNVTRLIRLPELPNHGKTGVEQCAVLLPLLTRFGINESNLGWFVLDNAPNNDTTLMELAKALKFDPKKRRLRCIGHILNLIAEQYLFGQDCSTFEAEFKRAGPDEKRALWRRRGELGKLHNLMAHIMASGKRSDLFRDLQTDLNTGKAAGKRWKVILDGGIRWNSSYSMIVRALALRDAIDTYAIKLRVSKEPFDLETHINDYISDDEWHALKLMADQLEPLFRLTKDMEGNPDQDDITSSSHGALWELLPVFEHLLTHFEELERQAKNGRFNDHPGIQSSITLAWNKTQEYYSKTDASIAWMASLVLHPRWKWAYFEQHWTGNDARFVKDGKASLRRLWEAEYKSEVVVRTEKTPEVEAPKSYKATMLEQLAPPMTSTSRAPRASSRKDQLALYLEEPPTDIPLMEYWLAREAQWPQLAKMAFDFLCIPAMSSECERVFSSCAKQTTPYSSQLSGKMLWHQECLKNWQRRGAICMGKCWNAVLLNL